MGGRPAVPAEPATAPMLSLQQSAMDRLNHELSVQRDRFIRLQSVQTDLALDLPPSIPLPDGEEIPYGSSTRLKIRDPQQESEIYQKCIRPPPNRTISDGDSPPPFRNLNRSQGQSKKSDLFGRTVRCFGMKRNEEPASPPPPPPPPPCVHVPIMHCSRSRKLAAFSENAGTSLASVPAVTCNVPAHLIAANRPRPVIPGAYPGDTMRFHSSGTTTGGASGAAAAAAMGSATASGSAAAMGSATASGSAAAMGAATASGSAAAMGSAAATGSAAAMGSATAPGSAGASGFDIAPRSAAIIGPPPAFGSASVISSAAAFDSVAASGFTGAFGSLGATGSASASGSAARAAAAEASGSAEEEEDNAAKGSERKSGKSSV